MVGQSRREFRAFYLRAWEKQLAGEQLEQLERMIVDVVRMHPEYQPIIRTETAATSEFLEANPYVHMGLHIALREQLLADRPAGVRRLYRRILRKSFDAHTADHEVMACLQEVMLEAQTRGASLDKESETGYLRRLEALAKLKL